MAATMSSLITYELYSYLVCSTTHLYFIRNEHIHIKLIININQRRDCLAKPCRCDHTHNTYNTFNIYTTSTNYTNGDHRLSTFKVDVYTSTLSLFTIKHESIYREEKI